MTATQWFIFNSALFLLGFCMGVLTVFAYGLKSLKKKEQKSKDSLKKMIDEIMGDTSKKQKGIKEMQDRVNKAFDITAQQLDMLAAADGPQSNAIHGKDKNKVIAEVKRLEEEKMNLLKSVLADGYDPKLVTMNEEGEKESIKLSDFLKRKGVNFDSAATSTEPVKTKLKLSLVKKAKEETSGDSSGNQ